MIKELKFFHIQVFLKYFNSIENLYNISQNKLRFWEMLSQNKIIISNKIFSKLTDFNLKRKSKIIYDNLINQNIKIISIQSKFYPKELLYFANAPLVIFLSGNEKLLINNNKKIYILYNEKMDTLSKSIYNQFLNMLEKSNNYSVGIFNKFSKSNIQIIYDEILNEKYYCKYTSNSQDKLYIILESEKQNMVYEMISAICTDLVIIQASFEKKILNIVDCFLEVGKDIHVVPGNIYDKRCSFSNQLLKEGANVIVTFEDFEELIN